MTRCSAPQAVGLALTILALMVAPSAAARLSPGLPGHPTAADYARCTVRSFLVTPKALVAPRTLPRGVEASNRREVEAAKGPSAAKARG